MIEHVYRRSEMAETVDATYIATPDAEIRGAAEAFGADVIMTGSHDRASGRVAEAAEELEAGIVIVMQGDEPLIHPEMVDAAVEPMLEDEDIGCVNLTKEISLERDFRNENTIKVTIDGDGKALYFSREPIPNLHDLSFDEVDAYKQVCVIPFRRDLLFEFDRLDETPLERAESIDMLRLLENGYDVHMIETERDTQAVDTPEDHERVDEMMAGDELLAVYQ